MFPKLNFKSAFTLLEMLVVIGIIAVLVGMGTVYYTSAQKKARDAKRSADLKAIQNAMEQRYSICSFQYDTDHRDGITCASPATTIMADTDVPVDPSTGSDYARVTGTTTAYDITATLETTGVVIHVRNQQ